MKRALLAGLALSTAIAFAQDQATAPASAPTAFQIGSIKLSGTLDGYYSFNNNHPASRVNAQHNFDASANSFDLNFAKMRLEMAPEPVGFVFDFGFGTGMEIFSAGEPGNRNVVGAAGVVSNNFLNHVTQAYLSVKPKGWGGVQMDFGKFYTSAGAELTETYTNWNYSRSLLFTNGPFYHFGARFTVPAGSHFTGGVQLVNGWNNVFDNNTGKTIGFNGTFTSSKVVWSNTYYMGPENSALDGSGILQAGNVGKGMRNFFDTALTVTPSDNAAFYVNYDYGSNKFKLTNTSATWWTIAVAGKLGPKKLYFAPRFEIYKDTDGFITGSVQTLKEFTGTLNYEFLPGVMTKFEYRHDWSDIPYFATGTVGTKKNQDTALIGLVMYFPLPK
ncbi:MAG: outer membrane beta-barrel protein [Bryobacteraceae bacterium]